tara:strand:+ start:703 stop:951 length:249 start_codon:yes stop_codon:yes gene_type:complete
LKILNLILDESSTKPENPIIKSILSKLKSKDEVVLYILWSSNARQGAGIGGVCYKNNVKLFSFSIFIGNKIKNEAEYFALIQ